MNKKRKILVVCQWISIYPWKIPIPAQRDVELLNEDFDVELFPFNYFNLPLLYFKIFKSDLVFAWFAGDYAFFSSLFTRFIKRPIVLVIGGYDIASIEELKYGSLRTPVTRAMVRYALKHSDKVLTVDESLKNDAVELKGVDGKNIETLYTGYDDKIYKSDGTKEDLVITVAFSDDWNRTQLKGLDSFVKAAKFIPDTKFLVIGVIGKAKEKLKSISSSNVELIGPLYPDKLISYYQKAKVYCQLSMREGLPNAVCEAMLCECVPVGTHVEGIHTAIGNTGFFVDHGDIEGTVKAIKKALSSSEEQGKKAREYIQNNFSFEKRKHILTNILKKLLKKS
jgi:glycosyltransferase involved in cell wall biosynthesis